MSQVSINVAKKSLPADVAKMVKSSRKRDVEIRICYQVELNGLHWDGGSRSKYFAGKFGSDKAGTQYAANPSSPFSAPTAPVVVPVAEFAPVVSEHVYAGKPCEPTIYIHPADVVRYFGAGDCFRPIANDPAVVKIVADMVREYCNAH